MDKCGNKILEEIADSYLVQKNQMNKTENVVAEISDGIVELNAVNMKNDAKLDSLLEEIGLLSQTMGVNLEDPSEQEVERGQDMIALDECTVQNIKVKEFEHIDVINLEGDWKDYQQGLLDYAKKNKLDLSDPYDKLLTQTEKNKIGQRIRDDYLMKQAHCDKYDYMLAAFCGIVCGLIDSFFVGMPEKSKLGGWTDKQADEYIMKFSQKIWGRDEKDRQRILDLYKQKKISLDERNTMLKNTGIPYNQQLKNRPETLQQCIQYLEKKYNVNYDASSASNLKTEDALKGMRPLNHHIMSLAHSPSPIGLLFSIIDQFTGKASFVDNGKLIRLVPKEKGNIMEKFELRGSNFPARLICGFSNWAGHLKSDYVGSNTTRKPGSTSRGAGIAVPFMELLQFCKFNVPDRNGQSLTISELTIKMFEHGYDLRFAEAMAIPVVLNEFLIRLMWSLKSRFYHKRTWKESIPFGNHPELRRMLLVGHGVLCMVDVTDAAVRGKDLMTFSLHLNFAAWCRLGIAGLQEVRAVYKENIIDLGTLDDDLEVEWKRIASTY